MKRKFFKAYIINAFISGFYILKGFFYIVSSIMKIKKSSTLTKIVSADFFDNYREIADIISGVSDKVQSLMSFINLYIYGYPSIIVGLSALVLSSLGMFLLTEKRTKKTAGYYITMILSFLILSFATIGYIILSIIIKKIRS